MISPPNHNAPLEAWDTERGPMRNEKPTLGDAIAQGENQLEEKKPLEVGDTVILGTARASYAGKVRKITKKDIVIRLIAGIRK